MKIDKKDYMEFCTRKNNERGQYNDGYDLKEIEMTVDDTIEIRNTNDIEGFFGTKEEYWEFLTREHFESHKNDVNFTPNEKTTKEINWEDYERRCRKYFDKITENPEEYEGTSEKYFQFYISLISIDYDPDIDFDEWIKDFI